MYLNQSMVKVNLKDNRLGTYINAQNQPSLHCCSAESIEFSKVISVQKFNNPDAIYLC